MALAPNFPSFKDQSSISNKLLDNFFIKEDQKLINRLHTLRKLKQTTDELSRVSGIKNEEILKKLVELNVRPEVLMSLSLVPLVRVAWADGMVDEAEKESILNSLTCVGFTKDNIDYKLVAQWMERKPEPVLFEAWKLYVQGLCEHLSTAEKSALKKAIVGRAKDVASASGGVLGMNKISAAEKIVLKELENVF
jgi:hypothetical protein